MGQLKKVADSKNETAYSVNLAALKASPLYTGNEKTQEYIDKWLEIKEVKLQPK